MKESKKSYVGSAVFFDRLADDGWPEDAGLWPERSGGPALYSSEISGQRVQGFIRFSLFQFIKSLLRSRDRR
jgi:hypothetical protein